MHDMVTCNGIKQKPSCANTVINIVRELDLVTFQMKYSLSDGVMVLP